MAVTLTKLPRTQIVEDWLQLISDELTRDYEREQARAIATVLLAGLRGFILDFCTTHDRKRLDRALGLWLRSLDSLLLGFENSL